MRLRGAASIAHEGEAIGEMPKAKGKWLKAESL
jgi:hypothetical protein